MGDVLAITDTEGSIVGNYEYDAWGKVLTADTDIAKQNPIRYRGYYYDNETEYYYLQSRYYDSNICRFINADDFGLIKLISKNSNYDLFTYCANDPINKYDPSGNYPLQLTVEMYTYAFGNKKNSVTFRNSGTIAKLLYDRLTSSDIMNNKLQSIIENMRKKNKTTSYSYNCAINFSTNDFRTADGDLYLSVGHASFMYYVQKVKSGGKYKYKFDITIGDRYDFDFWDKSKKSNAAIRFINNNFGWKLQNKGKLKPYYWDYTYTVLLARRKK